MANTSKYAGMGKDALTAEIKTRRAASRKLSVDLRADEDTLRAALDTDDVENGEFAPNTPTVDTTLAGSGTLPPVPDANAPPASPTPPTPEAVKGRMPLVSARNGGLQDQVSMEAQAPATQPTQPMEDDWAGADIYKHKSDGFRYQVIRTGADAFNKPVKARVPAQTSGHPGFYWEGSEEEAAAVFTKE